MVGDGQVSMGDTIVKSSATKVRKLHEDRVLSGFSGSTADAFTLYERFETKLRECNGNLLRSAVELAKDWRSDKYLRRLDALLLVADSTRMLLVSGTGDIIEPDEPVMAIGSGGPYALAAARALIRHCTAMSARQIAEQSLQIAAEICVFTNDALSVEELEAAP